MLHFTVEKNHFTILNTYKYEILISFNIRVKYQGYVDV